MLNIIRLSEPCSLIAYRQLPDAEYDGPHFTNVKSDIRRTLLISQGYLCAYCMMRIEDNQFTTKIEHWKSQNDYPENQLDFSNMCAVCIGKTQGKTHCDSSRGDTEIQIDPANTIKKVESFLKYDGLGKIYVENDSELNNELDNIFRLNHPRLKGNRKAVLDAITRKLSTKKGTATKSELESELNRWSELSSDGKKQPYCGIAIFYLKKKISRIK